MADDNTGRLEYNQQFDDGLQYITEVIDKQFDRLKTLLEDGLIEENTYQSLALALTNKLNIVAVEEVLVEESTKEPTQLELAGH